MQPSSPHDTVSQMKYLKPLDFYEEIFKDILIKKDLKPGRLLGLDVSDKYVSLAVSDWKNKTAVPLRALDRQENNLSSMLADIFQSLIPEHNIVGFVVGTRQSCPLNAEFVFKQNLEFIIENLAQPQFQPWQPCVQPQPQPILENLHHWDQPQPQPILDNLWDQPQPQPILENLHHWDQPQPQPKLENLWDQPLPQPILENLHQHQPQFQLEHQPQPQPRDFAKTIMEKCYAVCALQIQIKIFQRILNEYGLIFMAAY
ncbi:hypothetical protein Dsin_014542 [Dipteronia sinensis]|uniref:YqgF/RNase H-like domain-containing protein n=1 Tax=Dipteronia sinensis TaxID=43782 RepID=A0AAE0AN97_9ROSI|nr:hypothetical protein Dsin_014542 [Dipteronia sinensis]